MQNLGQHLSRPLKREICEGAKLTVYCNGILGVTCSLVFDEQMLKGAEGAGAGAPPPKPMPVAPRGSLGCEVMFAPVQDD